MNIYAVNFNQSAHIKQKNNLNNKDKSNIVFGMHVKGLLDSLELMANDLADPKPVADIAPIIERLANELDLFKVVGLYNKDKIQPKISAEVSLKGWGQTTLGDFSPQELNNMVVQLCNPKGLLEKLTAEVDVYTKINKQENPSKIRENILKDIFTRFKELRAKYPPWE